MDPNGLMREVNLPVCIYNKERQCINLKERKARGEGLKKGKKMENDVIIF